MCCTENLKEKHFIGVYALTVYFQGSESQVSPVHVSPLDLLRVEGGIQGRPLRNIGDDYPEIEIRNFQFY